MFFSALKGDVDIRLAFNGTQNGLNLIAWAPPFFLPTSSTMTRLLEPNTCQMDMDVGEMFLNSPLRRFIRPYYSVNLTKFNELGLENHERRQRLTRLWFGFSPSPHDAVRFLTIAKEQARGDHLESTNPFF